MKKNKILSKKMALLTLTLLSVCLLTFAGTVNAVKEGYSHTCYSQTTAIVVDGKWTTDAEWTDALSTSFGTDASFRTKWLLQMDPEFAVFQSILVESADGTNDAGDYLEICFDGSADMIYDGGTAPQENDWKLRIDGHGTPAWYKGTGTGWATSASTAPDTVKINSTLTASPTRASPHYVYEIYFSKQAVGIPAQFAMRVAVNDAHDGGSGLQAWPPTSANIPNEWGDIPYSSDPIPEGLSVVVVIALSSVAVIAGSVLLRKRSITKLASKVTVAM
jgi:hypothetical protein